MTSAKTFCSWFASCMYLKNGWVIVQGPNGEGPCDGVDVHVSGGHLGIFTGCAVGSCGTKNPLSGEHFGPL